MGRHRITILKPKLPQQNLHMSRARLDKLWCCWKSAFPSNHAVKQIDLFAIVRFGTHAPSIGNVCGNEEQNQRRPSSHPGNESVIVAPNGTPGMPRPLATGRVVCANLATEIVHDLGNKSLRNCDRILLPVNQIRHLHAEADSAPQKMVMYASMVQDKIHVRTLTSNNTITISSSGS